MISVFKHKIKYIYPVFAVLMIAIQSNAQDINVKAKMDTASILIGQQTKLELIVNYRVDNGKNTRVQFPEFNDTIRKEIEILGQTKIDSVFNKNDIYDLTLKRSYLITSFDSGYWAIPPFKFTINDDTTGWFTEPLLLQVQSVAVDTTQAIKDIKPPFYTDYSFIDWIKDNMIYVYIILGTIILVVLVIYISRRLSKRKPVVVEVEKPKIPAHIIALDKLEKVKSESLWQNGKIKQYYSAVTDIVREYIENRYNIQALEQTTEEIIFGFRNIAVDEESMFKLKQLLKLSDLVKFAKENPLPNENEQSLNNAFDFVNGTKKEEEEKKEDNN